MTYPLTVNKGKSIELGVTATGSEPLTYQWSRDGELIDGATAEILSLVNVTAIDSGNYTVTVSNAAGQAESRVVNIEVIEALNIVAQPDGGNVSVGESITLGIEVEGTGPISYTWYHDGEPMEGGNDSTLHLNQVQAEDALSLIHI